MKVLILGDGDNWCVDEITDLMVKSIDAEFERAVFTRFSPEALVAASKRVDLIHHMNVYSLFDEKAYEQIKIPHIVSVRSWRFVDVAEKMAKISTVHLHVITKELQERFPNATLIPDGVFERFRRPFAVGTVAYPRSYEYKGVPLIEEACRQEDVEFYLANGQIKRADMPEWYAGLDLYVCASENEGHNTCVLEALAVNTPAASPWIGFASRFPGVFHIERSVDSIRRAIRAYNYSANVKGHYWEDRLKQFETWYKELVERTQEC